MAVRHVLYHILALLGIDLVTAFSSFKTPVQHEQGNVMSYGTVLPQVVWNRNHLLVKLNSTVIHYTLLLYLNEGLLSPSFCSRFYDHDGHEATLSHENCFYHGSVKEESTWTVVLSTCLGLRGSFGLRGDPDQRYHIEPLQYQLGSSDLSQTHVLYRGSNYRTKNGTCGTEGHLHPVVVTDRHRQKKRPQIRRQGTPFAIVEWTLVNDHAQYLAFGSNLTHVVLRAIEIANGVDEIYKVEGVRVVVVDVVTWTQSDQITVTANPGDFLDNFKNYSPSLPQHYDSAMLFTGTELEGTTIGIAFTATMCEIRRSAVGLVEDGGGELDQIISTTSHELGHIFAMDHDTEECTCDEEPSGTCIMQDTLSYPPPKTWSSCSVETIHSSLAGKHGVCLHNEPVTTIKEAACGNGIQEEGEACDCGSAAECTDPCCNVTSCQLVSGAECRAGPCCQENCRLKKYGTVCRPERNECDIEEYCTGDISDCPRDFYLQDLTPCMNNQSYCFNGDCKTRENQCQNHFGTDDGIDECYTLVNTQGNIYGHCGFADNNYRPCLERNAFCGQIQCEDGGTLETTPGIEVKYSLPSYSFVCSSVTTRAGSDEISPGLIHDGTKCGKGMVCLSAECVNISLVGIPPCPEDVTGAVCSGSGLCNNENKCSCFVGFTGTICQEVVGARTDEGDNGGIIAGAVIGVLLLLICGGGVTTLIVYTVLQSRSSSFGRTQRRANESNTRALGQGSAQFQMRHTTSSVPTPQPSCKQPTPTVSSATKKELSSTPKRPPERPPPPSTAAIEKCTRQPFPPTRHLSTYNQNTLS